MIYCTENLRHQFQPIVTTRTEFLRLKQYTAYQKRLALHLINYQRFVTSNCLRRGIRFNYRLYTDQKAYENYGLTPMRTNPNVLIMHERRFNRIPNCSTPEHDQIDSSDEHRVCSRSESIASFHDVETIDPVAIKLHTCSRLIAIGRGTANTTPSLLTAEIEQLNSETRDEEISLSKVCKRIFSRSSLRRQIYRRSSRIFLFPASSKLSLTDS